MGLSTIPYVLGIKLNSLAEAVQMEKVNTHSLLDNPV